MSKLSFHERNLEMKVLTPFKSIVGVLITLINIFTATSQPSASK